MTEKKTEKEMLDTDAMVNGVFKFKEEYFEAA